MHIHVYCCYYLSTCIVLRYEEHIESVTHESGLLGQGGPSERVVRMIDYEYEIVLLEFGYNEQII